MAMAQTIVTPYNGSGTETDPFILPQATYGTSYDAALFSTITGDGDYSLLTFFPMPPGISLVNNNVYLDLNGTPSQAGTFTIYGTFNGTEPPYTYYSLTVNPAPLALGLPAGYSYEPATPTNGGAVAWAPDGAMQDGVSYSAQFSATGGTPPYTFSATGFPQGLTMTSGGILGGVPGEWSYNANNLNGTVTVTDAAKATASLPILFRILPPVISTTVSPVALQGAGTQADPFIEPAGTYQSPYSLTFTGSGGYPPYTYTHGGGPLPTGLSFDASAGTVSGTPTAAGTFTFHVYPTDNSFEQTFTSVHGVGAGLWVQVTINPAPLTITANDASMTYGGQVPSMGVSYTGFAPGDDVSKLSSPATATTTVISASAVGTYPITAGGAQASNYTFTYVPGTLTIGPAALTVTAGNATMTYGGPLPALTARYNGFVNGDDSSSLTAKATVTTTAELGFGVGYYPTMAGGAADSNYTFNYNPGLLIIEPATLTVTANNESMTYGGTVPALPVTYSGFVNGDDSSVLSTKATATTTATSASGTGSYAIIAGGAADINYTINYVAGTLTVGAATLTVTANDAGMTYGGQVPSLGVSYAGFAPGDDVSKLSTPATATATATSASAAGTYPITAGGAQASNYVFTYVPGTLTIGPAALEVTADAATKVYNASDPSLQYTVSGLVNGDNNSIFTGTLGRSPGENVGTYPITQGTLNAGGNYVFNFTGNDLTITKAPQQISWDQRLLFGCDNSTQFQLMATASSGLPVTYTTSSAAVATIEGDILTLVQPGSVLITASQAGNGNYFAAADVTDSAANQIPALVRQHWNDVLFFDNSSDDYVQWQWYKNGNAIPGATNPYYSETPSLDGQYYVIATENTGATIQTCPLTINGGGTTPGGIKVFPNPASSGATVTVTCAYTAAALQGARLQIVDMQGKIWQQLTNVQPSMQVVMPTGEDIYIIYLLLSNGQKATVNVLIK